jgi:hypothetical protein
VNAGPTCSGSTQTGRAEEGRARQEDDEVGRARGRRCAGADGLDARVIRANAETTAEVRNQLDADVAEHTAWLAARWR